MTPTGPGSSTAGRLRCRAGVPAARQPDGPAAYRSTHDLEGHGIGGKLVRAAVEYAASQGLTVVPSCPFAQAWLERHPDVAAQVPIDEPV